jgi:hypothetical protein
VAILDGRDLSTCRRFAGYLADRSICTSLVELDETHRRLWIRLASVTRFSVALDGAATTTLIEALAVPAACAVPCEHEKGDHVLRADPVTEPVVIPHSERRNGRPVRLALHLGDAEIDRIEVILPRPATDALVAHLRACRATMRTA